MLSMFLSTYCTSALLFSIGISWIVCVHGSQLEVDPPSKDTHPFQLRLFGHPEKQAHLITQGFEEILRETFHTAVQFSNERTNYVESLERAISENMKLTPTHHEASKLRARTREDMRVPIYDMQEFVETALLRAGIYEKQIALAFHEPFRQRIGSIFTLWTLLATMTCDPNPVLYGHTAMTLHDFYQDIIRRVTYLVENLWDDKIPSLHVLKNTYPDLLRSYLHGYHPPRVLAPRKRSRLDEEEESGLDHNILDEVCSADSSTCSASDDTRKKKKDVDLDLEYLRRLKDLPSAPPFEESMKELETILNAAKEQGPTLDENSMVYSSSN